MDAPLDHLARVVDVGLRHCELADAGVDSSDDKSAGLRTCGSRREHLPPKRATSEGSKEAMAVTEIIVAAALTGHACVLSVIGPLFCGYECDPFNPSNGYELLRQKND